MSRCIHCGYKLNEKAVFCSKCGAKSKSSTIHEEHNPDHKKNISDKNRIANWIDNSKEDSKEANQIGTVDPTYEPSRKPPISLESLVSSKIKTSKLWSGSMFVFLFLVPSISKGGNPSMTLFAFLILLIALRSWMTKRTYIRYLEVQSLDKYFTNIYIPSTLSYLWRSFLSFVLIAFFFELMAQGNWRGGYGFIAGTVLAFWFLGSVFTIDAPLWVKRKINKYLNVTITNKSKLGNDISESNRTELKHYFVILGSLAIVAFLSFSFYSTQVEKNKTESINSLSSELKKRNALKILERLDNGSFLGFTDEELDQSHEEHKKLASNLSGKTREVAEAVLRVQKRVHVHVKKTGLLLVKIKDSGDFFNPANHTSIKLVNEKILLLNEFKASSNEFMEIFVNLPKLFQKELNGIEINLPTRNKSIENALNAFRQKDQIRNQEINTEVAGISILILNFLKNNFDEWGFEDQNLVFSNQELIDTYNQYIEEHNSLAIEQEKLVKSILNSQLNNSVFTQDSVTADSKQINATITETQQNKINRSLIDAVLKTKPNEVVDIEEVNKAIDSGADLNTTMNGGYTPLHLTAFYGRTNVARLLISRGADVNVKDENNFTPIDRALQRRKFKFMSFLRKHGGKHGTINKAAFGGDRDGVKEFLVTGSEVNAKDKSGSTPLHYAASAGHNSVVEFLLKMGGDVNAVDKKYGTPLDSALKMKEYYTDEDHKKKQKVAKLIRSNGGKTGIRLKLNGK
jgi:ankyrin repeat protein